MNGKMWICSGCNRVYPHDKHFCPKCNISKKHATRFIDSFIRDENKIQAMKAKHERFVNTHKKIMERHK